MNRFRRNLVKITNIFALSHLPHLHFTQVLNSCSCILPAAGRRPPGGSVELRSPAAVLPHRRPAAGPLRLAPPAKGHSPYTVSPAPPALPLSPDPRRNWRRSRAPLRGALPAAKPRGPGSARRLRRPLPPPRKFFRTRPLKSTARRRSHRSAPGVPFRAVVTAAAPPSYLPWGGP